MLKKNKDKTSQENIMPVVEEVVEETPKMDIQVEEDGFQPLQPIVKKKGFNFKLLLFLTILTATVTGLLAGGFYVYFTGVSSLSPQTEEERNYPTPVPVETPITESSPSVVEEETSPDEKEIDITQYEIQVLNGSGKIGEASKVEKILTADKYKVVGVGNAPNYNFKQTVIAYKKDVPTEVIAKLKDLLAKAYDVSSEDGTTLAESGKYDIVVTVGSQ